MNEYIFNIKTDYPKLLKEIKNSQGDFIVVDTGDLERIYKSRQSLSEEEYKYTREKILMDIDLFIGDFFNQICFSYFAEARSMYLSMSIA